MKLNQPSQPVPSGDHGAFSGPAFTPGTVTGPFAPPDRVDQNVGGQIGLLNTEKDIAGIEKVGI